MREALRFKKKSENHWRLIILDVGEKSESESGDYRVRFASSVWGFARGRGISLTRHSAEFLRKRSCRDGRYYPSGRFIEPTGRPCSRVSGLRDATALGVKERIRDRKKERESVYRARPHRARNANET